MHILVAGVSARAIAESAARAGYAVTAIDAFADRDQAPGVRSVPLPLGRRFTAMAAARAVRELAADAVVYGSSFDNHPLAVATLAGRRALWGNPPGVLTRVRNPALLADALRARGLQGPAVCVNGSPAHVCEWMLKPRRSGGGRRVRPWRRSGPVPAGCYLQERIEGTPGSIVFVAAKGSVVPLAVTRQLAGDAAFGARGYQYCGNIVSGTKDDEPGSESRVDAATALARAVAGEFGLTGVNGIDYIWSRGAPYAIEVNPRWCASMELAERFYGVSVFAAHAAACARGELPRFDLTRARPQQCAAGKAIVYARHPVVAGNTDGWLADRNIRDVPHAGGRLRAGQPVCTVFAEGRDAAECHEALAAKAGTIYRELDAWRKAVA